jgi:uncharacterized protein YjiS (DUF1127 family)
MTILLDAALLAALGGMLARRENIRQAPTARPGGAFAGQVVDDRYRSLPKTHDGHADSAIVRRRISAYLDGSERRCRSPSTSGTTVMSVIETTRPAPLGSITTFRIVSGLERIVDAFVAWRSARATAVALSDLSDQQLADIGLVRGQIDDVADALARR